LRIMRKKLEAFLMSGLVPMTRAAAVTTDPLSPWGAGWEGGAALPGVAEKLARPAAGAGARIEASREGEGLVLRLFGGPARPEIRGRLLFDGGPAREVVLAAAGDGLHEGVVRAPTEGPARLTLAEGVFDGGLVVPYPEEFGSSGPWAEGIGSLRRTLRHGEPAGVPAVPLSPFLAAAGILLFVLDRALRARRGRAAGLKEEGAVGR